MKKKILTKPTRLSDIELDDLYDDTWGDWDELSGNPKKWRRPKESEFS